MAEETTVASFIGSEKVISVAGIDQVTPMGNPMVEVTFESGRKQKFTKKTYELVVTDVASDASITRRTKFNQMVPAIKAVICEYGLTVAEIQALLQEVGASIDNNFARATNYAWTANDELYIPNTNPLYDRDILDADAIIKSIPEKVAPTPAPENDSNDIQTAA